MKGTIPILCPECNTLDDESHRLNYCTKWADLNNVGRDKTNFNDIYSEDEEALNTVLNGIENLWELKFANGRMKR